MSGKEKLAKAVKREEEAFLKLQTQRGLTEDLLKDPDRLRSHVRVPQNGLSKLEAAVSEYKTAVVAVVTASEEQDDTVVYKAQWYKDKIPS